MTYPFKTGIGIGLCLSNTGLAMGNTGHRYFRLSGVSTDYISIPDAVLSTDFSLRVYCYVSVGATVNVLGNKASTTNRGTLEIVPLGQLKLFSALNGTVTTSFSVPSSLFFTMIAERVGSDLTLSIVETGDSETFVGYGAGEIMFDSIGGHGATVSEGIFANVEMNSGGLPFRNYPISSNSNDIPDTVSGQDGAVINGGDGDWGLFKDQTTLWKGHNLSTPPWSSAGQELVKQ